MAHGTNTSEGSRCTGGADTHDPGGRGGGVCDGSDGDTPGAWQRQGGEDGGGKDGPVHGTPATTKFTSKHTFTAEKQATKTRVR